MGSNGAGWRSRYRERFVLFFLEYAIRHGHIVSVELRGYPHLLCSALMP